MAVGNKSGAQYMADLDQRFFDTLALFYNTAAEAQRLIEECPTTRKPITVEINGERIEV